MEGNIGLLGAVAWPFLAAFISLLAGKKGERNRDVFASAAMVMEFTGMLCLYPVNSPAAFSWAGFCEMGIWLRADGFRWLYSTIAAFMWMMTTLFSMEYFARHGNRGRYCFFSLLTCGATMGVFLSDSLFSLFLFFEIMGLTSFVMVIQEETEAAGRAARTYLAIAVIGGLCALSGIFMIAAGTGNLSMDSLEQFRKATGGTWPLYLAGALLLAGFGAKAGMYPLHVWLPNAHPVAPAPASALLSGILTKTGVFGILAVTVTMFRHDMAWGMVLLVPGAVTMVLGAILAVFSIDLKRTLACSSMSQIGFILTGCAMQCLLGEENGLAVSGTVLHMVNHSMIKLVLFMAAGCIYMNLHKLDLNEIRGYGRNKPFLMLVFAMGAYGICGIPLWNGYVSKTLLHESIVEYIEVLGARGADALPFQVLEWAFLLAGGLTVAYMAKLFAAIFLEKAPMGRERDDREKRYAGTAACFALGGSACLLPLMGMAPPPDYGPYGRYQPSVFKGGTGPAPGGVFFRGQSQGSLYQHINRNSGVCAVHPQIPYGDRGGRDQGLCGQMAGMAEPGGPGLPPPGTHRAALFGSRAGQMRQWDLRRSSSPVYEKAGKKSGGGTGGVQPVFQAGPGCKASAHDLFQHGIRVHDAGGRAYTDDGICAVFMRNLVGKKRLSLI